MAIESVPRAFGAHNVSSRAAGAAGPIARMLDRLDSHSGEHGSFLGGERTNGDATAAQWTHPPSGVRAVKPLQFGFTHDAPEFGSQQPEHWIEGESLAMGERVALPAPFVTFAARKRSGGQNTSHQSADNAVNRLRAGFLELIRNDAALIAWHGGLALTEVHVHTIKGAYATTCLYWLRQQGGSVRMFLAPAVGNFPVIIAVYESSTGAMAVGVGCEFDQYAAASEALGALTANVTAISDEPAGYQHTEPESSKISSAKTAREEQLAAHLAVHSGLMARAHYGAWLDQAHPTLCRFSDIYSPIEPGSDHESSTLQRSTNDVRIIVDRLAAEGFEALTVQQDGSYHALVPGLLPLELGWPDPHALRMSRLEQAARMNGADGKFTPLYVPHPFIYQTEAA